MSISSRDTLTDTPRKVYQGYIRNWKTQCYKTINSSQVSLYGKRNLNQNQRPRRAKIILKKKSGRLLHDNVIRKLQKKHRENRPMNLIVNKENHMYMDTAIKKWWAVFPQGFHSDKLCFVLLLTLYTESNSR